MKNLFGILMLILLSFTTSCKDDKKEDIIGNWHSMKWKVLSTQGDVTIDFRSDGYARIYVFGQGSIDIECSNYSGFWFPDGSYYPELPDNNLEYVEEWVELKIEGNVIHCNFLKNEPNYYSAISTTVTAGNIFYDFEFIQNDVDGKWTPMEWEVTSKSGDIEMNIISEGETEVIVKSAGSIDIACVNYKGFWFEAGNYSDKNTSYLTYTSQWCDLEIDDNVLHCNFSEMESSYDKQIDVDLTAGDVFNHFHFIRE